MCITAILPILYHFILAIIMTHTINKSQLFSSPTHIYNHHTLFFQPTQTHDAYQPDQQLHNYILINQVGESGSCLAMSNMCCVL